MPARCLRVTLLGSLTSALLSSSSAFTKTTPSFPVQHAVGLFGAPLWCFVAERYGKHEAFVASLYATTLLLAFTAIVPELGFLSAAVLQYPLICRVVYCHDNDAVNHRIVSSTLALCDAVELTFFVFGCFLTTQLTHHVPYAAMLCPMVVVHAVWAYCIDRRKESKKEKEHGRMRRDSTGFSEQHNIGFHLFIIASVAFKNQARLPLTLTRLFSISPKLLTFYTAVVSVSAFYVFKRPLIARFQNDRKILVGAVLAAVFLSSSFMLGDHLFIHVMCNTTILLVLSIARVQSFIAAVRNGTVINAGLLCSCWNLAAFVPYILQTDGIFYLFLLTCTAILGFIECSTEKPITM